MAIWLLAALLPLWLGLRARVRGVLDALRRPVAHLDLLAALLERLERERFECPLLADLQLEFAPTRSDF